MLKDFKGYLQTDGYVAYDDFEKREGITLMHCMHMPEESSVMHSTMIRIERNMP
jgi:hypothetical protein